MRGRWRVGMLAGVGMATALALATAGVVWAAGEPIGSSFRVSDRRATADDFHPAVAWNNVDNQYLVVWEDQRDYSTRYGDIYGQRLSATGSPVGPVILVSGGTAGEGIPAVAWNATSHEYLVVWIDQRNFATRGEDIYGRRVGADGSLPTGAFRICGAGATANDTLPDVAWNGTANEYLVVWEDGRNRATRGSDIYGQRVSALGSRLGGNRRLSGGNATGQDTNPAVAWNGTTNQYLVTWADYRNDATRDADVYARLVSAAGRRVGPDRRISGAAATAYDGEPDVTWNRTNNQYLVVWADARNSAALAADIYGQRLSSALAKLGGNFRIGGALRLRSADTAPAVTWNGRVNQYLVVWQDNRAQATRKSDIYGQRLSASGARLLGNFRICDANSTALDQDPAAAVNAVNNQYMVVWTDWRNVATRGRDIYGQRVTG